MQELIKALVTAQTELKNIQTDSMNPHFKNKYASLAACLDATKEILAKYCMVIVQTCRLQDHTVVCVTTLWHSSGQSLVSEYPVVATKQDAQGYGSGLSYARRYSLLSILNLAQDDDDGASASKPMSNYQNTKKTSGDSVPSKKTDITAPTQNQLKRLFAISKASGWSEDDVKSYLGDLGLTSTKELNYVQYEHFCKAMQDYPKV